MIPNMNPEFDFLNLNLNKNLDRQSPHCMKQLVLSTFLVRCLLFEISQILDAGYSSVHILA